MTKIINIKSSVQEIEEILCDRIEVILDNGEEISTCIERGVFCCERVRCFITEDIDNIEDIFLEELRKKYINKRIKSVDWDQKSINKIKRDDEGCELNAIILCIETECGKFMIGCSNTHGGHYRHIAFAKYNGKCLKTSL